MMLVTDSLGQDNKSFLDWEIGYHKSEKMTPKTWMPSVVPGAVQLDVMKAENYRQPYWFGDNVKQFDWMEDWFFTYRTIFSRPDIGFGKRIYFHSKGIDYHYKIILNGYEIYEHEGMFTYVSIDLTDKLKSKNELRIMLKPIPKIEGGEYVPGKDTYRQNARESAKPAVSYGWDWHPRLVTRGIWDETYLEVKNSTHLTDAFISYQLDDGLSTAALSLNIEGKKLAGARFRWILKDRKGKIAVERSGVLSANEETISAVLKNPALWWPNGYGNPILYSSEVILSSENGEILDGKESKVGFRKIRLITNEGEWARPTVFPVSRNRAPASLEVNGKRIFGKGTNWVHPEIFIGLITKETYQVQLQLAKDANLNILRVWGGGITNKEAFFDLCDEMGLLVWQEFPLACNNYTDDAKYLSVLEQEAISIIKRVKRHACLAMWSGGNELFNSWGGMTEQSLALRLLNSLCYRYDKNTPFIFTSPLYGMGHGSYLFFDKTNGKEVFQWMAESDKTAYPEFGVPGTANLEVLKQFIPENELFPPQRGTAWETHHGFGAWRENSWLELPFLEEYFGEIRSIEDLVRYSQLTQSEGLKFIYEESRRQKPYCSMALNWCFQEPWPAAANNSIINWPNVIKPAYHHVASACRPVLASLRASKFRWSEGEIFTAELFMLNDAYKAMGAEEINVSFLGDHNEKLLVSWKFEGSAEFENTKGPGVHFKLPSLSNNLFRIKIEVKNKPDLNSEYTFLYRKKTN